MHRVLQILRRLQGQVWSTTALVATLGIGIGVNAALWQVVDKLIFRGPPFVREPEQLVNVLESENYVRFLDLHRNARSLDVAAIASGNALLEANGQVRSSSVECVTNNYFSILAVPISVGRGFIEADDRRGAEAVAVVAGGLARRVYGAPDRALGQTLRLAGRSYRVIGVAPVGFRGLDTRLPGAWVPLGTSDRLCSYTGTNLFEAGGSWLSTIGRLRSGFTMEAAALEVEQILERHLSIREVGRPREQLARLGERRGRLHVDARVAAWLAAGGTTLLALVSLNALGLMLIRAVARRSEMSIRVWLGAARSRLVSDLLAEHAITMLVASLIAAALSWATGKILLSYFPYLRDSGTDLRSAGVAMAVVAVVGLVTAVVPFVEASRAGAMRPGIGRGEVGSRSLTREVFLAGQTSVAFVLVVCASLFAASIRNLMNRPGFDMEPVLLVTIDRRHPAYADSAAVRQAFQRVAARLVTIEGVQEVSMSSGSLLGSGGPSLMVAVQGAPREPGQPPGDFYNVTAVSGNYFKTLGTRILKGRSFDDRDAAGQRLVTVVSQDVAASLWPDEDPIGRCATVNRSICLEIIGVSETRRRSSIVRATPELFVPWSQAAVLATEIVPQILLVRSGGASTLQAIRARTSDIPALEVRLLRDLADVQTRSWRLGATMFGLFGAIALALAAVGVYWSSAFAVESRRREIGVRMALGASPSLVRRQVIRDGMKPMFAGWVGGVLGSLWAASAIASLLYGIAPTSVPVFLVSSVVVAVAGVCGCMAPAMRAAAVDPARALQE